MPEEPRENEIPEGDDDEKYDEPDEWDAYIGDLDDDDLDDVVEEAMSPIETLIAVTMEIGPANTLHTVGKFLEGLDPAYKKLAEKTIDLANRCARRHNAIVRIKQRRAESEAANGEANNPTG